jgi:hypothetical protein
MSNIFFRPIAKSFLQSGGRSYPMALLVLFLFMANILGLSFN